ncbi:MAG: hypothetical protein ACRCS5_05095 [Sphingomonas sp.]|uniref:hypothetical protein n=1 Tax=Sphingomonas sp. TaxID=28214 RepID=UPI003F30BAE2
MKMGKSKHWQREVWHHGHLHGRERDIVGITDRVDIVDHADGGVTTTQARLSEDDGGRPIG